MSPRPLVSTSRRCATPSGAGLFTEPERTLGGHCVYHERTVTVLEVIKRRSGWASPFTRPRTCSSALSMAEANQA